MPVIPILTPQYNYDQEYYDQQYQDADPYYADGQAADPLATWQEGSFGEGGGGPWQEGSFAFAEEMHVLAGCVKNLLRDFLFKASPHSPRCCRGPCGGQPPP